MRCLERIYKDELPSRAISLYIYLLDRQGRNDFCWPSIKTISQHTKMSRSTVKRAIRDLLQAGYIEVEYRNRENGAKTSSVYKILTTKLSRKKG